MLADGGVFAGYRVMQKGTVALLTSNLLPRAVGLRRRCLEGQRGIGLSPMGLTYDEGCSETWHCLPGDVTCTSAAGCFWLLSPSRRLFALGASLLIDDAATEQLLRAAVLRAVPVLHSPVELAVPTRRGTARRDPSLGRAAVLVLATVRRFLAWRRALSQTGLGGSPFLHCAAEAGAAALVRYLTRGRERLLAVDAAGRPPLYVATRAGHASVVSILCERRAEVNAVDQRGASPVFVAAELGHARVTKTLLLARAAADVASTDGSTPLITAATRGYADVVECLCFVLVACARVGLGLGGGLVDVARPDGVTALSGAASEGHVEVASVLLSLRAAVDYPHGVRYPSPLLTAAFAGHVHVVELLCSSSASLDGVDMRGITPVRGAAYSGHEEVVAFLISADADVNKGEDLAPIHAACVSGHGAIAILLLSARADLRRASPSGQDAFDMAIARGHVAVVAMLLDVHIDVNRRSLHSTPLTTAADNGHLSLVQLLVSSGAQANVAALDGHTTWLTLADGRHSSCVSIIHFLGAASPPSRNGHRSGKHTPLVRAACNGHLSIVRALVSVRAGVNEAQREGAFSPIHGAADCGHLEVVKFLCAFRANADAVAFGGVQPLFQAREAGHQRVVDFLSLRCQSSMCRGLR